MINLVSFHAWVRHAGKVIFLFCLAAFLLAPMITGVLGSSESQSDNRALAPAPGLPRTVGAVAAWPPKADAYLNDHFGLRPLLVRADVDIRWYLLASSKVSSIVAGRNGRIFLSDGDVSFRVVLGDCGAWWSDSYRTIFAHDAETALRRLRYDIPDLSVLVVPTSPVLYPNDLPVWMARACAGRVPLVDDILNQLPSDLQHVVSYPRSTAAALPLSSLLIPKHNFHWDGYGVDLLMQPFIKAKFHLPRVVQPFWTVRVMPADLATFLPGIGLSNRVSVPDWSATGVRFCFDPNCLQRPPLDSVTLPRESLRATRSGSGGKLLLLSDSFGTEAAATLVEYFRDVIVINMNNFQLLPPEQREHLWHHLTIDWHPDHVLVVIEDGNITLPARFTNTLPPIVGP